MILKCLDGPMDGAVYVLSRETSDPQQRSTNRKPDGLWFDGKDEFDRNVQHQYAYDRLAEGGDHVTLCYRYTGPVVDTGLTLEIEEHVVGTREREPEQLEGFDCKGGFSP